MTTDTDALLAADPSFNDICDARRDECIAHMEAAAYRPALDMDRVYRDHYAGVVRYLRSRGCSRDCAEDIAQTAFVKAHRARHAYNASRGTVGAWLYTIARTVLLDAARTKARRREFLTPDGAPLDVEAPVAEETVWPVDAALAMEALSDIGADQRAAVTALHLDGLSLREAAARQGCSEGALRVRAHRGYVALRASLT